MARRGGGVKGGIISAGAVVVGGRGRDGRCKHGEISV